MFREYAVEPAVLSSWDSIRYFLDAFGPWKGRFLAKYPKHWLRLVYEGLACGAAEKKKIEIRLEALDRRIFTARKGALYDGARPWIDNASAEHACELFSAIIAAEAGGRADILDATMLDEHQPLWRLDQGRLIARDSVAFVAAVQLKPTGDIRNSVKPMYSVEMQTKPLKPTGHPQDNVAFKLDSAGNPVPKGTGDIRNPYTPQQQAQYEAYRDELLRLGHQLAKENGRP